MPKTLIAILLFLSLSYQLFVKLGVVVWYECNKSYIAQNLCENKDKPEMKCCGKCYLRKQLKKADDNSTQPQGKTIPSKWHMGEVVDFVIPAPIVIVTPLYAQMLSIPLTNELIVSYQPLDNIFRPPLSC